MKKSIFLYGLLILLTVSCSSEYSPNQNETSGYKISFDANGGVGSMDYSITLQNNQKISLPTCVFTRSGFVFRCWNTKKDGSGTKYNDGQLVQNLSTKSGVTVKLYAQWSEVYSITYKDEGGSEFTGDNEGLLVKTHAYDTTTTLDVPTKYGFSFVGWFTTPDCTGDSITIIGQQT